MSKQSLLKILVWSIVALELTACGGGIGSPGQGSSATASNSGSADVVLLSQGQVNHAVVNGSHYVQMSAVLKSANM
jgi:hypothetical protein